MSSSPSRRDLLALLGPGAVAGLMNAADAPAVPADMPRTLARGGADLGTVFPEVAKLAARHQPALSFLGGKMRSYPDWQAAARAKVFELLQYEPEPVDPKPEVIDRTDCGTYIREKVLFSTSPIFRVPAYVLIPKNRKGRGPAIVDLHSHGGMFLFGKEKVVDLGRNHPAMVEYHKRNYDGRPTATALVQRGYVVITIDALLFGERRVLVDADQKYGWDRSKYSLETVRELNMRCRGKEATMVKSLIFAGATWPGIVFQDDRRTVDYLVSRPDVDPKRIGCLGISMGGYRSLFLAGLDPRIRAACVTGFMSTTRPMIQAHIDTHSWVHFLPGLHRWLDWPDVAALAAPRALMVQQCAKDRLFPLQGMKDSLTTIGTLYDRAGCKEQFAGRFYDAPHQFTLDMQKDAFAWLDRHLEHRPG